MVYDEPYRWVEAVSNRREYLEEQLKTASPVVALPYDRGIAIVTFSSGTPKLYEIYDRIVMGGLGHPADLERLRAMILDMAHLEGFNRSPSDVTSRRLIQFGLAPSVKQAFEEIYRAPYIAKLLFAELGTNPEQDRYTTLQFDGAFAASDRYGVLAAAESFEGRMRAHLDGLSGPRERDLTTALREGFWTWGVGAADPSAEEGGIEAVLRDAVSGRISEAAVLDRHLPGLSKYRVLSHEELEPIIAAWRTRP